MKKVTVFMIAMISCLMFFSFGMPTAAIAETQDIEVEGTADIAYEFANFKDRTSFYGGDKKAAEYISEKLTELNLAPVYGDSMIDEFFIEGSTSTGETQTYYSYNVVAQLGVEKENTVIIGTNYTNSYKSFRSNVVADTDYSGALESGVSVATLLKLAEYYSLKEELPCNIVFAFFAGTNEGNYGSKHFLRDFKVTGNVAYINLERLGGENTYVYTGEQQLPHASVVLEACKGLEITEFPESGKVLFDYQTVEDLDFTHVAMRGDVSSFMTAGYKIVNFLGGRASAFGYVDGNTNLFRTVNDGMTKLSENYPDYDKKAAAAITAIKSLLDENFAAFASQCQEEQTNYPIYFIEWVGYALAGLMVVIALVVLIVATDKSEKKNSGKKQKVAVFGKDFE